MPTARGGLQQAADPISEFFELLAEAGHLETFEGQSATLRFDVLDGTEIARWHLSVTKGQVTVTRQATKADAIVRVDRPHFEAIVTGRLNAQAAMLRGLLTCEGDVAALVMFQRSLPGPPGSTGRAAPITSAAVMNQRRAM
jgi:predicted lipid carrier protein YhbT